AIWISPFFKSPMRDFGYDISDYRDIDPMFGTLDNLKELLLEAHKRKIHIIIDMVLNHTSDEHPWFEESRKSLDNSKADWYLWHSGKNAKMGADGELIPGKRPNNWFAQFELKNAWWYEPSRKQFYLGTFTKHQPELNWRNDELRAEMFDLARYWLDMGVDGFRLDVINWFIKDDQFRSNPFSIKSLDLQKHIYDRNRPETIEICRQLRKITDSYDQRMMVGEVFTDNAKIASEYCGNGSDALHMAFNFNFLFQRWNAKKIYQSIIKWYDSLVGDAWPNFTFSNHDNLRHSYRYRKGKDTQARCKVAAALLMTLRGTPFIYYGEELGMTGGHLKKKDMKDPLSYKTYPIKKFCRDLARTPMQWDSTENSGFSSYKPWLTLDGDYIKNNVEIQNRDESSLLNSYKALIWLRKNHTALQTGSIKFYTEYLPEVLAFARENQAEKLLVILNFSNKQINIKSIPFAREKLKVLFGSHKTKSENTNASEVILRPYEVIVLEKV
ncbi:MAG: alpha-amylase family glycosyl hydrolase, partial [Ruminiclostridium sp.]